MALLIFLYKILRMNAFYSRRLHWSLAIAILLKAALYTCYQLFIVFLRFVWKRNKMHDREIALWNARMRIYFDANVMGKVQFLRIETSLTSFHFVTWFASLVCVLKTFNDYCRKYCLGCRNLQRHSQLPTWWTHIFFFFRSFHFFSSRPACLAL